MIKGECVRTSGHVTGSFVGGGGLAVKDFKGPSKHNIRSRITHSAKINR